MCCNCWTPQFTRIEAHGVDRLRLFPAAVRIRVWINKRAVYAVDHSLFASDITGETGVPGWIEVASDHAVTGFEARCQPACLPIGRGTALNDCQNSFRRKRSPRAAARVSSNSSGQLLFGEDAFLDQDRLESGELVFIVA